MLRRHFGWCRLLSGRRYGRSFGGFVRRMMMAAAHGVGILPLSRQACKNLGGLSFRNGGAVEESVVACGRSAAGKQQIPPFGRNDKALERESHDADTIVCGKGHCEEAKRRR
jgi:hypothetical protein